MYYTLNALLGVDYSKRKYTLFVFLLYDFDRIDWFFTTGHTFFNLVLVFDKSFLLDSKEKKNIYRIEKLTLEIRVMIII